MIVAVKSLIDTNQNNINKAVYFKHDPTGLGAQISRRIMAVRVGLITGCRVNFPEEDMYPYQTCFEPLSDDIPVNLEKIKNFDFNENFSGDRYFNFWNFWSNDEEKLRVYDYVPKELLNLSQKTDFSLLLDGIIFSKMHLTDKYKKTIAKEVARLDLPDRYVAIHYRRGDKTAETPYVPVEMYRSALLRVMKETGVSNVYVASDSPSALEDLRLKDFGVNVFFDFKERRLNNANHRYLMKNINESENETITAIKNIHILSNAVAVVGQDNAHFATLAAGFIYQNSGGKYYGELLDGRVLLNSKPWKLYYLIKSNLRRFAKKILPRLTLRNINKP